MENYIDKILLQCKAILDSRIEIVDQINERILFLILIILRE